MAIESDSLIRFAKYEAPAITINTAMRETISRQIAEYQQRGGVIQEVGVQSGIKVPRRTRREQVDYVRKRTWNAGRQRC